MNRRLRLGPRQGARRPRYLQLQLEPLEDRKLLATLYYNDDWTNETNPGAAPVPGNAVGHATDFGGVTGLIYGTDAFGLETNSGAGSLPNIKDALDVYTVTARRIFYNNSGYDGNNAAANAADLSAEDTTKSAFRAGQGGTITGANTTSYSKGINGVIVELTGTHGPLTAADFTVRMSGQELAANNMPSSWPAAPAPTVTVFSDTPVVGTDRIHLIWPDGSIVNRYLEVIVEGNDAQGGNNTNTGLAYSDIFFFANRVGDTFNDVGFFNTDATDEIAARNNPGIAFSPTNAQDFNKDFFVDATDQIISRNNQGFMAQFGFTFPPAAPAPRNVDGGDSAIATSLSIARSELALERRPAVVVARALDEPSRQPPPSAAPPTAGAAPAVSQRAVATDAALDSPEAAEDRPLDAFFRELGDRE